MTPTIAPERPDTADATMLIEELEASLAALYPSESRHGLSVERLIREGVAFFVLRDDGTPAACGGVKLIDGAFGELKRMYVRPQFRGRGHSKLVLQTLEYHARTHGITLLRLETGIHQLEAIGLYQRMGFAPIPPFEPYKPDPLSLFFEKRIESTDASSA